MEEKPKPATPEPELPEALRAGVYANYFGINANNERIVLDFGSILPETGKGIMRNTIVSRVITSKEGAQKLAALINKMIQNLESLKE